MPYRDHQIDSLMEMREEAISTLLGLLSSRRAQVTSPQQKHVAP